MKLEKINMAFIYYQISTEMGHAKGNMNIFIEKKSLPKPTDF